MADGRRNLARVKAFNRLIDKTLGRRIGSFDAAAAQETAILMRSRQNRGEPRTFGTDDRGHSARWPRRTGNAQCKAFR